MAEPAKQKETVKQPLTLEEKAAQQAADNRMSRIDPLAQLVQQVANDYQALGQIFDEKARRLAIKNKDVPPDQQELPDPKELKALVDAGAAAVQVALAYREDQRKSMIFTAQMGEMRRRDAAGKDKSGFDFIPAKKKPDSPKS